ncbi:MAG: hypothetical protein ABR592_05325 [Nitriliruptorales bacterium]
MPRDGLTVEHKEALAKGRQQALAVRAYLQALETGHKPGRPVDRQAVAKRIEQLQAEIDQETSPVKRVELIQRRIDAERQLARIEDQPDFEELERGFVEAAQEYSERRGITYSAWRELGVPAAVLREAGVPRATS